MDRMKYFRRFDTKQLDKICQNFAKQYDTSEICKHKLSNGNCVKILFQILSEISPTHKVVYEKIKDKIWSNFISMVSGDGEGLIEEFKLHGMKIVTKTVPGSFLFIKKTYTTSHVGLVINENEFMHLCKKGLIREKIVNCSVSIIGVF